MGAGRDIETKRDQAASTLLSFASHPSTMFASSASPESKQRPRDILSSLPTGLIGDVISSFLEFKEKVNLLQLTNKLNERLGANHLFKQALNKQLLCALVGAFQQPHSPYLPQQAASLLKGTLQLTKSLPVEQRLALAASGKLEEKPAPEEKEAKEEKEADSRSVFDVAFKEPLKQALAKDVLLELVRAHQYPKAAALLKNFPPFLNSSQDRLDYLFALMVSGYQNEASAWLDQYPELLLQKGRVVDHDGEVFTGLTPYQYTLCLKHTQMRKMIREKRVKEQLALPLSQAALQAEEFELGKNRGMEALKLKYSRHMERTRKAYKFYCKNFGHWTIQQCYAYWRQVIGGLIQGEWPVHWMQELFYRGREFNGKTDFSSAEALQALPEAKYHHDGEAFYPWNLGYVGAVLEIKSYPPGTQIDLKTLSYDRLWLIQQGEEYHVYGFRFTGNIEATVEWELIKLRDVGLLADTLKALGFTAEGRRIKYDPALNTVYAAVIAALLAREIRSGFSFPSANVNYEGLGVRSRGFSRMPSSSEVGKNLAGLTRLDITRTMELADELSTVKQHLPQRVAEATSALRPPSPFR